MTLLDILFWISVFAGGLLVVLMLLSLLGGADLDIDLDTETDADAGFGIVKSSLTLLSVGSWTAKIIIASGVNLLWAIIGGALAGLLVTLIFIWLFKFFMNQQKEVNWHINSALGQVGKVYLRIPAEGTGIVHVDLGGTNRDIKAISIDNVLIPTGADVKIIEVYDDHSVSVRQTI